VACTCTHSAPLSGLEKWYWFGSFDSLIGLIFWYSESGVYTGVKSPLSVAPPVFSSS
jgi:hypothetical protein